MKNTGRSNKTPPLPGYEKIGRIHQVLATADEEVIQKASSTEASAKRIPLDLDDIAIVDVTRAPVALSIINTRTTPLHRAAVESTTTTSPDTDKARTKKSKKQKDPMETDGFSDNESQASASVDENNQQVCFRHTRTSPKCSCSCEH